MSVPASRNALEAIEEDGGWMEDGEELLLLFPLCENEFINSAPSPSSPQALPVPVVSVC